MAGKPNEVGRAKIAEEHDDDDDWESRQTERDECKEDK